MNERDKETIKLIATIFGNIAAIATGIGFFEAKPYILIYAAIFGLMAMITIRRL